MQARPGVEEIEILGVRPGELARIPSASTDRISTADRVGENATLADVLGSVDGVWVRRLGGRADGFEVSIRGSAANQVLVTLDGVPINSVLTGVADPADLCLPQIESVAVTRGAGASLLGSGAIGGVVDLAPHAGGAPITAIGASGGAFDTVEGSLRHAGSLGPVDYGLVYCGLDTEGDFDFERPSERIGGVEIPFDPPSATRDNNDRQRHGATLALGAELPFGAVRFRNLFDFERGGSPGFDSGNGPDAGQSLEARARDLGNLAILGLETDAPLGGRLDLRAHHRYEKLRFRDPLPVLGPPIDVRAETSTEGVALRSSWTLPFGSEDQTVGLFADGARDDLSRSGASDRARWRSGGGAEVILRGFDERVVVSLATRVDWADDFSAEWLPSAGLVVSPLPWLRFRGNAGRAYRTPSFNELHLPDQGFVEGNPDLDPEDAWSFDVGGELVFDRLGLLRDVRLRGSWFHREVDESIVWLLVSPSKLAPRNTGSATSQGFELAASFAVTDFLRASVHHTTVDSERDANGAELPGHPDRETFARLQLGPPEVLKLIGEVRHTGTILVNEGGNRRVPSRTVWNASAALNLVALPVLADLTRARALWVFFEIDNIGDVAVRDSVSFPQPGRNARAGVELAW